MTSFFIFYFSSSPPLIAFSARNSCQLLLEAVKLKFLCWKKKIEITFKEAAVELRATAVMLLLSRGPVHIIPLLAEIYIFETLNDDERFYSS